MLCFAIFVIIFISVVVVGAVPDKAVQSGCCGGHAYSKNDPSNPCLSVCGDNQVFDRETELCCQGVVRPAASGNEICCGTDVISRRSHRCCRDRTPFTKHYMQCNRQGKLERKRTGVFTTRKLCRGRLPTWADGWPQPALTDNCELL
nr:hypothetical protein BaRGS_034999 [Batillaria attramentaria]